MAPKRRNERVIHLPSLPLLCLMLSCCTLPLWPGCLHHCCSVPGCSNTTPSFLSAELLLFGSIMTSTTRVKSESFLLLCHKILKLTSVYSEQFCPELMRFLTCLRILRIKLLSLGRGRFSKIISNSLNHHGSRKRDRVLPSEKIYRLEARTQRKTPASLPSSINTSESISRK